jgi:hypothetical protein
MLWAACPYALRTGSARGAIAHDDRILGVERQPALREPLVVQAGVLAVDDLALEVGVQFVVDGPGGAIADAHIEIDVGGHAEAADADHRMNTVVCAPSLT